MSTLAFTSSVHPATIALEELMAIWVCEKCKKEIESRCRPAKCPNCGAARESFKKK